MLFNREIIEQGRQVIKKWEGICYSEGTDRGIHDCFYCIKYFSNCCLDCPICFFSGTGCCRKTPYTDLRSYRYFYLEDKITDEKGKELALNMLNYVKEIFIKSLLLLDLRT